MSYQHTQRSLLPLLVLPPAVLGAAALWTEGDPDQPLAALGISAAILLVVGLVLGLFSSLTVRQEGRELLVHFGPLPWIRRRIPFSDIVAHHAGRSSILDGWGIHWRPPHGWIWNLWGRECVVLELSGGRRFRIGTNDVEGLVACLDRRSARSAVRPAQRPTR